MKSHLLLLLIHLNISAGADYCLNKDSVEWLADENNCADFYVCMFGFRMKYTCPVGTVTNSNSKSCVPKGSWLDTCKERKPRPQELAELFSVKEQTDLTVPTTQLTATTTKPTTTEKPLTECETHASKTKIAVNANCAQYVDCTDKSVPIPKECPYPLLFDEEEENCVPPRKFVCGIRKEPKSPCEYDVNKCTSAHCVPCEVRLPSCLKLPDGPNAWNGRDWTPYFVVCREERVVYQGSCSDDGAVSEVFHPTKRTCVDVKELKSFFSS